ncbi:YetF domain-containing protein [Fredinandcohnia sp. 179-A 10B2 NHS]|uniref:YetF domain-containing protein n=1 Tax=Fredinandcohnia sp. 179-A 10B2 NHS TaxID=3235176 RepID=UPI0039A2218E
MDILELAIRVALGFIVLFSLARIMGRKEISQMTFFNFVSAIAIGSIAANLVVNQNLSIRNGVLALIGWTIFTLAMDIIDIKSKKARKITTGTPQIVIKDGKIVEKSLRKLRLDLDSLTAMLRQKNIFSMTDVNYAILETDGKLSVMLKEEKLPVTKKDMNILSGSQKVYPLPTEIVSDGKVLTKNLSKLNLDQEWLTKQLQEAGIESIDTVMYAEVQQDGSLFIDRKENIFH